jgi:hypothetical protein
MLAPCLRRGCLSGTRGKAPSASPPNARPAQRARPARRGGGKSLAAGGTLVEGLAHRDLAIAAVANASVMRHACTVSCTGSPAAAALAALTLCQRARAWPGHDRTSMLARFDSSRRLPGTSPGRRVRWPRSGSWRERPRAQPRARSRARPRARPPSRTLPRPAGTGTRPYTRLTRLHYAPAMLG